MRSTKSNESGGVVDRLSTTYQHLMGKKAQRVPGSAGLGNEIREIYAPTPLRQEMLDAISIAANLELCAGPLGEASIRLDTQKYLVTRSRVWFAEIQDQDLVLASGKQDTGFPPEGLPQHWDWHHCIYDQITYAKAVLLTQPAAATALAAQGKLPDTTHLKDVEEVNGMAISTGDTENISAAVQHASVVFVMGFGVLAYAETLQETIAKTSIVNRLCEIELLVANK